MKFSKQRKRTVLKIFFIGFILMNIVAFFHAYTFTHFTDKKVAKTKDAKQLGMGEKLKTLLFGIDNPRPVNKILPSYPYETLTIQSETRLEAWSIKAGSTTSNKSDVKGTVIFFHGFTGEKSEMLERADVFLKLGYNALLVDFRSSGGSEGNQTTVGFKEAEDVKASFEYVQKLGEKAIYLFGTSMGAAAVLKAQHDYKMPVKGLIVESPFGSMYETVCARFNRMSVPSFPMAGLLVFWGGVQNGFWAFSHNPKNYAKTIDCPVLMMSGKKDETVNETQTREIFDNFKSDEKTFKIYPNSGHEGFLKRNRGEWVEDVQGFIAMPR
jgi:uncharacterized protein